MSYSGPYFREEYHTWAGSPPLEWFHDQQYVYKTDHGSARINLPYNRRYAFVGHRTEFGYVEGDYPYYSVYATSNQAAEGRMHNDYYGQAPVASNRARSRFVNKLRQEQSASIGAALGEWSQSFHMIADRLKQLVNATSAVRHGDLKGALQALSLTDTKGHLHGNRWRREIKQPANLWLEWHFGWSPMLSDIHSAMEVLSSALPQLQKIHSSAKSRQVIPNQVTYHSGELYIEISGTLVFVRRIEGFAKLVNPSFGLLEQLGLVNPAGVIWELVPFSFLIDHVIGIGNFIDSFTDTIGWELSNVSVTDFRTLRGGTHKITDGYYWAGEHRQYGAVHSDIDCFEMHRFPDTADLPNWCLTASNPFRDISVSRAATYCSLLIQNLNSIARA